VQKFGFLTESNRGADVAEHKQIEEAVKECHQRFLNLFRESPVLLTLSTAKDHRYIEVNDAFERLTGWKRNEVIGRTAFDLGLWEEPDRRVELVKQLLSGSAIGNIEIRFRTKNGEIRTGSLSAMLVEVDAEKRIVCMLIDLTNLKHAEEAKKAAEHLSSMAHRLIQGQEDERKLIAHELHEHIDQLLLLSLELERSRKVQTARQQIENLAIDLQALSRRLRSTELQYLGLPAAIAAFCKKLSDEKRIEIDFVSEGITQKVSDEVSVSLYRILEEALLNATSYSGSKSIQVVLKYQSNEVQLIVRDSGIGFDVEEALKGPGFGLTIMQERVKMVGGALSIESQPKRGTTIHARVPLATFTVN
jgi:PAS domain S-box-containing protein